MACATGKLFTLVERWRHGEESQKGALKSSTERQTHTCYWRPRCTFLDATVGGVVLGIYCTAKWGENSGVVAVHLEFLHSDSRATAATGSFSTAWQGQVAQAERTAAKRKADTQHTGNWKAQMVRSFFFALLKLNKKLRRWLSNKAEEKKRQKSLHCINTTLKHYLQFKEETFNNLESGGIMQLWCESDRSTWLWQTAGSSNHLQV